MRRLFVYVSFRILLFSLLLSVLVSFVAAQIELLDSVERKVENLLHVFVLSFGTYFFDVLVLSLPISAFRFFFSESRRISYLKTFGMSPLRFLSFQFLACSLFFTPVVVFLAGYLSGNLEKRLRYEKRQYERGFAECVEGGGILVRMVDGMGMGDRKYVLLSKKGEVVGVKYEKAGSMLSSLIQQFVVSLWLSFITSLSAYLGLNRIKFGWFFILFVSVPSVLPVIM